MSERQINITVIVTVFNKESDLPRCLQSLKDQTDRQFYTVVIDDGSSDQSIEILRKWEGTQANGSLLIQTHSGVSAARNLALSLVQTDYVVFLDGDDSLTENAVEILNREICQEPCDLIIYGISHLLSHGNTYNSKCMNALYASREEIKNHFTDLWNTGLMYSACNKMFRMDLIRDHKIAFPQLDFGEDIMFCQEYLKQCCSLHMLPYVLYRYTYHKCGSLSSQYRVDLFERRVEEHEQMLSFFDEMNVPQKESSEYLSRRHIERIVGCIENEHSPESDLSISERYRRVQKIVFDPYTQSSAYQAKQSNWKMKLLILPIRNRLVPIVFLLGALMSFCRRRLPELFAMLKYR